MSKIPDFDNDEALDPEEELRLDNQIKRLELEMTGAKFMEHNPEGIQLPPEVEAQMLDHILKFEKFKKTAKEVKMYDFLKSPKFKKIEFLASEEIILEKERLLKLFSKRGVILTSIMPVEDEEMYRFMTTDFFEIPVLDMPIEGFVRHFIYEEFHPNAEVNVMQSVHAFIEVFFNGEERFSLDAICKEKSLQYLTNFRSLYSHFEGLRFDIQTLDIKKIKAHVSIKVEFEALIENSRKSHRFDGLIDITLWKKKNFWYISDVILPKLS